MSGTYDIVVAGAGPAGLAAAALAAREGAKVACLTGPERDMDPRTVALMQPSLRLLEALDLWPGKLMENSAALKKLRLVDNTGRLISAPELSFDARETGADAFGWNIPLSHLIPALKDKAKSLGVTFFASSAKQIRPSDAFAEIITDDGASLMARAVFAADGRNSVMRREASIGAQEWAYDQEAIVTSFAHSAPHDGVSVEYHTASGPFTTVPLPGNRSSLVWMERPERAEQIANLSSEALAREIQRQSHGNLGLISDCAPAQRFPMRGLVASLFARERVYLIGEAAHVVPPIGAQGLNMSLRDAALAVELACDGLQWGDDPGAAELMKRYDARRRTDVMPRQKIIDVMNRSLLSDLAPFHMARALGIGIAGHIPFIRSRVMAAGLAPEGELPRLMRAEAS